MHIARRHTHTVLTIPDRSPAAMLFLRTTTILPVHAGGQARLFANRRQRVLQKYMGQG
jgi:hypothetical protein